jgi:hypothetical protein
MPHLMVFFFGLVAGNVFGMFLMGLLITASRADEA